jgi:hypothetical protein
MANERAGGISEAGAAACAAVVRAHTDDASGGPAELYGAHAEPHALDACTRRVHKDNEEVARDKHKE